MIKIRKSLWLLALLFLILVLWHFTDHFFVGVDGLGFQFQKYCVESINSQSEFNSLHKKIICSYDHDPFRSSHEILILNLFKSLGLVHLLVASGTHLLILQKGFQLIFGSFTKSKLPIHLALILFVFCSNFCGPVTRCYFQFLVSQISKCHSLGWASINLILLSSVIYLLFFPSQVITLSFWLSLSASLCLSLFSKNLISLSFGFYFCLLPYIYDFNWPSFSWIFVNLFITPYLSLVFIWNSFFYLIIKNYYWVGDHFYFVLIHFLKFITDSGVEHQVDPMKTFRVFKFIYGFSFVVFVLYIQKLRTVKFHNLILNKYNFLNRNKIHKKHGQDEFQIL